MYKSWAANRRMRFDVLAEEAGDESRACRIGLAISGFGAHTLLSSEAVAAATFPQPALGTNPGSVVRRYRLEGSPLVRDSVAGWRTGRVESVMEGNFDLLSAQAQRS